ncbi:purine-nucleoside phosphorylase [Amphibiibacter pelophylacis]|uniref:Purine-nucleoside phosphorylase n=1 Tax=Amphibiibacter pelophylacis TaxID=1799477 RepID=A0ACC6P3H1_9BURK
MSPTDPVDCVDAALNVLRQRLHKARPRIALVLGSGWGGVAERIEAPQRVSYADLPGFPKPTVQGHASDLLCGRIGAHEVAVLTGRKHSYETGDASGMVVPLRTLRAWGCDVLVQTNAAGSVRADMPPGSLMLMADHLNLAQRSPLVGETGSARFVDMAQAYDPDLRAQARAHATQQGLALHEGVYAWLLGPQFETPAEIRMTQVLGADAVGMSTVPETIIARHAGMRVLALSLMTNMGAGLSAETLSHAHTLQQAQASSAHASGFLHGLIAALAL